MKINLKLLLATLVMITIGQRGIAQQNQKKNLLFIITDQQQYKALGIAGNTVVNTPNLDRLAEEGAYFKNAYTPCAVCSPARASILTGHTVENTGMNTNDKAYDYVEPGLMTMPTFDEVLAQEGYHCEYYGKWHSQTSHTTIYQNPVKFATNGKPIFGSGGQTHMYRDYLKINEPSRTPGMGEFADLISRLPYVAEPLDKYYGYTVAQMQASNLSHSQPDQHGGLTIDKENSMTAFQAKQTIEAIERLKDSVFSITCSFHFPHTPMVPTEPYASMYPVADMVPPVSISDNMWASPYSNANGRNNHIEYADTNKIKYMISNYYGLITEIDDWVGKILNKLDEHNLTDNTLIIFTSDHGEMLGAHGMREKNVFYEESAHIPLLMRLPGEIDTLTTVNGYVSLVDLFPTILDYLNVPPHPSDGKSLRGLIDDTDQEHGKYVVTEWDYRGDVEPNYMIVKDGWKLMIPYTASATVLDALYDLNTDPHETDNLLLHFPKGKYDEEVEELGQCLLSWLAKNNSTHFQGAKDRLGIEFSTSIELEDNTLNKHYLAQNYPNPFRSSSRIHYRLAQPENVNLAIYDMMGKTIKTLVNQQQLAGEYEVMLNGEDFSAGVYLYRIEMGVFIDEKKFAIIK